MVNLLERLVDQLDSLVPYLGLVKKEVFVFLRSHYNDWFSANIQESLPKEYDSYQTQVVHSAFLLGYSYFEAFLADLARQVYKSRPQMLPNNKQLNYSEILGNSSIEQVVDLMIEKEVLATFYKSMEEIIEYFEDKLQLKWSEDVKLLAIKASLTRNCLLHNGACVSSKLAEVSDWQIGQPIVLRIQDVHDLGVSARSISKELYEQAQKKHFKS